MNKKQCHNCGSDKFGLVRQRWLAFHFCSRNCKVKFFAKRKRQVGQTTRWLNYLAGSPT
jgi:hypothetical protein